MQELDTIIASILYLMTRQTQSPKVDLSQAIVDHMQMLTSHPDCDSEALKNTGERLSRYWSKEARGKKNVAENKHYCQEGTKSFLH